MIEKFLKSTFVDKDRDHKSATKAELATYAKLLMKHDPQAFKEVVCHAATKISVAKSLEKIVATKMQSLNVFFDYESLNGLLKNIDSEIEECLRYQLAIQLSYFVKKGFDFMAMLEKLGEQQWRI